MADQIKIKNIYYMLSYAYQNLNEGPYKNIDLESFNNIHDLLSAILIRGTSIQINEDYTVTILPTRKIPDDSKVKLILLNP